MTAKRRGRPVVGVPVQLRIPADLLARIDELAAAGRMSRARLVRTLLEACVAEYDGRDVVRR